MKYALDNLCNLNGAMGFWTGYLLHDGGIYPSSTRRCRGHCPHPGYPRKKSSFLAGC
jgi:hypothetical protein